MRPVDAVKADAASELIVTPDACVESFLIVVLRLSERDKRGAVVF
jgi:hypothetical protein